MYPYRPGSNFLSLPGCMPFRAQLFKGRVTLSKGLIAIQRITANITYCAIPWIANLSSNNVIQNSNNR